MLKDNPLPSTPKRSDSGLYTVLCINTKRQYIGHSNHVQQRLTIHKYQLRHNKHFCFDLQEDFNRYEENSFVFERIALGESYPKQERQNLEKFLIKLIPKEFLYNKFASFTERQGKLGANFGNRHSIETKEKIGAANLSINKLNKPLQEVSKRSYTIKSSDKRLKPVSIDGIIYSSVAQAYRETGIARRLIRQRCWSVDHPSYTWLCSYSEGIRESHGREAPHKDVNDREDS